MGSPSGCTVDFLAQLGVEELRRFHSAARATRVRKGQIVVGQDLQNTDVFFIESGVFQVLIYSKNGRDVSIRTLEQGAFFGELAALDLGPRTANVVALSDGKLVQISGQDFKSILEVSPLAALWLARYLASQARALTERIFELSALDMRSRLHRELLRLSLVEGVHDNQATIRSAPTHHELASRIGTHREAVTRELRDLTKQGLLSQARRELVIHNIAELFRVVERASGDSMGLMSASRSNAHLPRAASA